MYVIVNVLKNATCFFQQHMAPPWYVASPQKGTIIIMSSKIDINKKWPKKVLGNLLKTQSPIMVGGGGRGVGGVGNKLSTFDAESKSAKIPKSQYGGVGWWEPSFNFWC